MALANYTWTEYTGDDGTKPIPNRNNTGYMTWGTDLTTAEVTADESTGKFIVLYEGSCFVKPVVEVFTGMHSSRFFFLFDGDGGFPQDRPTRLRFYKQRLDGDPGARSAHGTVTPGSGYFEFSVERRQTPNGPSWVRLYLKSVHRYITDDGFDAGPYYEFPIMQVNTMEIPTGPWCAGIEWFTNGADQNNISDDLATPELPELGFVLRLNSTSHDTDSALPISSIFVDLATLSVQDPDTIYNIITAMGAFGTGFYDYLVTFEHPQTGASLGSSTSNGAASAVYFGETQTLSLNDRFIRLEHEFPASFFQRMFALNEGREGDGFVPGNDGKSGLIQPVDGEDWDLSGGCIGWEQQVLGFAELILAVQIESWDDLPVLSIADDFEEEWES